MPVDASSSITFTLNGYQPETEKLEAIGEPPRLRPNPVVVEFSPASPSTAKKPAKPAAKKPATRPKAAAAPAPCSDDSRAYSGAIMALANISGLSYANKIAMSILPARIARPLANSGRYRQYQPEFLYRGCEPWDSGPGNG